MLLVHPGGPFWSGKDAGAWSIPKGELDEGEDPLAAAVRELAEETGWHPTGEPISLDPVRQGGGKMVFAWAIEADVDPATLQSNTFSMEWPPRSGQRQEFPEVDRAAWYSMEEARGKILPGQAALLDDFARKWNDLRRLRNP